MRATLKVLTLLGEGGVGPDSNNRKVLFRKKKTFSDTAFSPGTSLGHYWIFKNKKTRTAGSEVGILVPSMGLPTRACMSEDEPLRCRRHTTAIRLQVVRGGAF